MAATVASVVTLSSVPSPLVSLLLPEVDAVRLTVTVTEVEAVPLETTTEVAPVATQMCIRDRDKETTTMIIVLKQDAPDAQVREFCHRCV